MPNLNRRRLRISSACRSDGTGLLAEAVRSIAIALWLWLLLSSRIDDGPLERDFVCCWAPHQASQWLREYHTHTLCIMWKVNSAISSRISRRCQPDDATKCRGTDFSFSLLSSLSFHLLSYSLDLLKNDWQTNSNRQELISSHINSENKVMLHKATSRRVRPASFQHKKSAQKTLIRVKSKDFTKEVFEKTSKINLNI